MSARPTVDAALLARMLERIPTRLRRRLDQQPRLADAWTWTAAGDTWTVQVEDGVAVTLAAVSGTITSEEAARCTCLLAPRCLHLAACLDALEPISAAAADPPLSTVVLRPAELIGDAQRAAAGHALDVLGALLACGARGAGAVVQADLLRAIHGARTTGCHRLANAMTRTVVGVRRRRLDGDAIAAADLAGDVYDAAIAACAVLRPVDAGDGEACLGTARRRYHALGALRLHGIACEAVLTRSGHAGVVTWLVDARGRRWSLADVQPGDATRVAQAYGTGVSLGEIAAAHRELAHAGAMVQDATGSADGRLGAGRVVQAVLASGGAWTAAPLDALFRRPLADQVATSFTALALPEDRRPAGDLLLFVSGVLIGEAQSDPLLRTSDGTVVRLIDGGADPALPVRVNLDALAGMAGTALRVVGRLVPSQPRTLVALAVGPAAEDEEPDANRLALPAAWSGRCNLGLDVLGRSAAPPASMPGVLGSALTPWDALAGRLELVLVGGRLVLPAGAAAQVAAEGGRMAAALCPTGSAVLHGLYRACQHAGTDRWGALHFPADAELARAWTAAATYVAVARRSLARACWHDPG